MPLAKSKTKPKPNNFTLSFEAIGTQWTVEFFDTAESEKKIEKMILQRIETFDKNYSRFRTDSLVTKMSQTAGKYTLPADAKPMMDMYEELYQISQGLMTPLIGQALSDAGYDASYSFRPKKVTSPPSWDEAMNYNFPVLNLKKPFLLDFGALGKGYLVDILGELLTAVCDGFIINAGGDILAKNGAVEVALENPNDTTEAIGIATINGQAICGSAGNRRAWAGYSHILNPKNLSSPQHIAAVWVVAKNTMLADALTTALYFVDVQGLHKRYNFDYAMLKTDGSLVYSSNFPATFFNPENV
ncbi:MAG: ApbE-like protein thiamine biosynthesis lipoprotein [Candidatus Saccharibacteria bacterium]|nr:ApbE-like protein thiamine biosynthesis lipoprotein [Candidatus Saccharibacteria bacterium]